LTKNTGSLPGVTKRRCKNAPKKDEPKDLEEDLQIPPREGGNQNVKCASPYQGLSKMGFAKEYPCGRCLNCRINRAEEWSTRILLELEDRTKVGDFVTLTFDDDKSCPLLSQALSKRVLQNYFKRLRKAGNKIKYFACGEYGEKHGRAHYHAVIIRGEIEPNYEKHWKQGNVVIGNVTKTSARYCTGYLTKSNTIPPGKNQWPPFQLQSQGMGAEWAMKNKYELLKELPWTPRYLVSKANISPEQTSNSTATKKIPTRNFSDNQELKQRRLNAEGQRSSKGN